MKKILCFVASCFVMTILSTSCNKTCTCTTYIDGNFVIEEEKILPEDNPDAICSDLNDYYITNDGKITGMKCE